MDQIKVEGELPVALKKLVGQTTIESKKIVMIQLTAIEYYQAQAGMKEGQWIGIADLVAMIKLIADDGAEHEISYDMLGHSSKANIDYLNTLKSQLEAKEKAES
ncbi:hypothetical protein B9T25_06420 [Acinetobacter sp. ANC 4470]|uniref:hypothetical protein n=1 Tax=Acinetobacter sp. ANC 4470 TaxID=1977881 RepID=UPI000A3415ED|nr:hypothetical protein [Acinetobacter sp. ANC 4470]OTG68312.1 hypothetical protein B9T25_06420 [Acinetobacter sp. ANC 4470]